MWWNGSGWGHMHGGWWFMPIFGLLCMVIFLYVIRKIFGNGSFCHRYHPQADDQESINSLKKEIQELRKEIKTLHDNDSNNKKEDAS